MAKKDLSLNPHKIPNANAWWYEENKGISVYVPGFDSRGLQMTREIVIKWADIRRAIERKDRTS